MHHAYTYAHSYTLWSGTKRFKGSRGRSREMNYSRQNNTVIFVDCEGLTLQSDAGLTDTAPPSSAACCRNKTPSDGLETQEQTSPIDFPHFWPLTCPSMANSAANALYSWVTVNASWALLAPQESLYNIRCLTEQGLICLFLLFSICLLYQITLKSYGPTRKHTKLSQFLAHFVTNRYHSEKIQ